MDARKRQLILTGRHLCYALSLLLAYVLQTTPGFLSFGGIKPVLLVPFAIVIAAQEGVFAGSLYGAAAGLMWDIASGRTAGFFAIQLMILCFLSAALVAMYLRGTVLNLTAVCAVVMTLLCTSDYLFTYQLHGYAGLGRFYLTRVLPVVGFSAALTFFPWFLERAIRRKFTPQD